MTAALALIIGVATLCSFIIAFVALLARASGADATIARLRGELADEVDHGVRLERDLMEARKEASDAKLESGECKKQVAVLTEKLTQRAEIDKLTQAVEGYRAGMADGLATIHTDLSNLTNLLTPTRKQLEEGT